MPSKKPRITIVVDPPVYEQIEQLAERRGVSLSMVARDLIREALVMEEDVALARLAGEREATLREDTALSHAEVWG
jgi:predicted transcriptional regulator